MADEKANQDTQIMELQEEADWMHKKYGQMSFQAERLAEENQQLKQRIAELEATVLGYKKLKNG